MPRLPRQDSAITLERPFQATQALIKQPRPFFQATCRPFSSRLGLFQATCRSNSSHLSLFQATCRSLSSHLGLFKATQAFFQYRKLIFECTFQIPCLTGAAGNMSSFNFRFSKILGAKIMSLQFLLFSHRIYSLARNFKNQIFWMGLKFLLLCLDHL